MRDDTTGELSRASGCGRAGCGPLSQRLSAGSHLCLGSSVFFLGIFSPHDYLSGKIVIFDSSQFLNFKMFSKALLIWGARESLKMS